jgi:hypothetical protein
LPTDDDDTYVDFVREGIHGNGAARVGNSRWWRLTEERSGSAKSVFHFDVQGSVAKSTHAGIPWLRFIRERFGQRVHFWSFDGWDIPAGRSAIAEVYPALWSRSFAREDRNGDQHDAYSIAAWLSRADRDGSLAALLKPDHNMWVINAKLAVLSVISGGGKWVEITIPADPLYQHLLLTAEKKFWRCVEIGEPPRLFGIEPPRARIEAVRVVDMSQSNSWAEFADMFLQTRDAFAQHERAKAELKALVPEDAKEAVGHGIRARRSKVGAISFELLETEATHAPVQ